MLALYREFASEVRQQILPVKKALTLFEIDYVSSKPHILIESNQEGMPDFDKKQKSQNKIGKTGEELVFDYEKQKLNGLKYNPKDYFNTDISKHYDILSYNLDGSEIHIEVKTKVRFNNVLDFYMTEYEYDRLIRDHNYAIYYVTDINSDPKLFILNLNKMRGDNAEIKLVPTTYRIEHIVKIKD